MSEAIGIDLGGTKVAVMRVDDTGAILERTRVETPHDADPSDVIDTIAATTRPLLTDAVQGVAIGAAGLVGTGGIVRFAANLGWREVPLADRLQADLGVPIIVDNDANVAAWGEYRFGAGAGAHSMLCVTVGTGLGGGLVLGGRLFRGAAGLAGEIGHIIVEPGGPLCGCGNHGCWEQVASGTAIQRAGRAAVSEDPDGALGQLAGGDPDALNGQMVTTAAQQGDPIALDIFGEVGRRLGEGIAGLVNVLDPDRVVIGGGASEAGDLLLTPTQTAFEACVEAPDHRPKVPLVPAALGNDAGGIGAALLVLDGEDAVWAGATA